MKHTNIIDKIHYSNEPYLYAETSFIHEGSKDYLFQLIDQVANSSIHAIKFQILINYENYYIKSEMHKINPSYLLTETEWQESINYAFSRELDIIILPLDEQSILFCQNNISKIVAIEIHSVLFNDYFFIENIKGVNVPLILGIGGRTLHEIKYLINHLDRKDLILMYGFQNFPTKYTSLSLSKISKLSSEFAYLIGYADHTVSIDPKFREIINYAYILGARLFEIHIILNKSEKRVDAVSAHDIDEINSVYADLNLLITILNSKSNLTKLNKYEFQYRERERQIVARKFIKEGTQLKKEHFIYKITSVPGDFKQHELDKIVGKIASMNINEDDTIQFIHLKDYK